ncbi:aldehyde dehydrogenase family protein [Neptuniibacter pectenicola]|jgi:aldehyde dehydrogenase|uniref:Aldehyde dehydrogenase family protein n=1 Tax=Neptuniibacter pectenicola TaxID=1806669 RepID=A0ABU9TR74_9GAMM|nr:aldehyde dehydrogenase family protein [Neptuniibacter pectenicola]KXJ51478.1 MAG: aldehyde dehydrogenase [Neptuniibacter sp. Phe_28]|tara:strand:- start:12710 stop:14230 length:1521 start_codon:yes stop_codon:yes gene_type:complete|eukprot:gnl/Carplike_NY0171/226_a327_2612.p1 GENE.gnl/Carplike_NY0171/226_a327_2612~~gnl/Carplike_NY0171/226_a327_2612.p1  ORF type:complete len:507 (+),score=91.97 gnl/Carplike_NY0171/226_a327_2612:77-1597(+)
MIYAKPGTDGAVVSFKERYGNFINGQWVAPINGQYFTNHSPVTGEAICEIPRSTEEDINAAIDAAEAAKGAWGKASTAERSGVLLKIADRIEEHLERLAVAETWDNGKAVRETLAADVPLMADHFRYFAGCIRAQEGSIGEIDETTVAYHFHEPLGVVGQIIPWNFPLLMAAWKIAPALAAGNTIVLKPAEQTPVSILILMECIGDLLPAGTLNIVNGFGAEAGQALASSTRIAKIAFTGSTPVGSHIMKCAAENIIPSTTELGGKSPNVFFKDVLAQEDEFVSKAIEGAVLAYFNQGEVCTCPSRILVQEDIADEFIAKVIERAKLIKRGNPLDTETMVGAQASQEQFDKILGYMDIGREEGAEILMGGGIEKLDGEFGTGYYIQPTLIKGTNDMRVFQEEIFGPVVAITTFKDEAEALEIANDTEFGLGAGVWTRDTNLAYRMGRGIQAGRVWMNCYHLYPAHAAFGGYKKSGVGRENHKMMLDHYQQTKNMLVSYSANPLGFF